MKIICLTFESFDINYLSPIYVKYLTNCIIGSLPVCLSWMKFGSLYHLSWRVHEPTTINNEYFDIEIWYILYWYWPDGAWHLHPGVDCQCWWHHKPAIVVLHLVLQEGGDTNMDILEEVQNWIPAQCDIRLHYKTLKQTWQPEVPQLTLRHNFEQNAAITFYPIPVPKTYSEPM